jgi:hypothetical protein
MQNISTQKKQAAGGTQAPASQPPSQAAPIPYQVMGPQQLSRPGTNHTLPQQASLMQRGPIPVVQSQQQQQQRPTYSQHPNHQQHPGLPQQHHQQQHRQQIYQIPHEPPPAPRHSTQGRGGQGAGAGPNMWDPVVTQQQQIHQGHIRAGVPGPGAGGGGRTSSKRQATERAPRVCSFIITLSCLDGILCAICLVMK